MRSVVHRRHLLAAAMLGLAVTLCAGQARAAWVPMDEPTLTRLMARIARLGDRTADFRETKTLAQLDAPLVSQGRLSFQAPARLEKTTVSPQAERVVVDRNRLSVVTQGEAPKVFDLSSQPQLSAFVDAIRGALSGDLTLLRRYYRVSGRADGSRWQLALTPADARIAESVRDIAISGSDADVRSIHITQADGNTQRIDIGARH